MPCSCGNTICPCGIPCYCSEELCKCQACAMALCPSCKICNKPLITDIQTGEDKCSCFVGDSTVLIFENRVEPQWRMGNIPMPVGYVVPAKLIVNVMIPVLNFPEFVPQRPISLMPSSPSMQADSRQILPSFISDSVVNPLCTGEDDGLLAIAELHESSNIRSEVAHITKSSNKETYPPPVLQSTDGNNTENIMKNLESETDDALVQELSSFFLPSVRIGDISYPVGLEDPVWRLPNPNFRTALGPSLKLYNPFYMPGPAYRTQTVTDFEQDCRQPASSLNFVTNDLTQSDSFDPQIRAQPSFNILREPAKLEELLTIAKGSGSTASSLTSSNSEENMYSDLSGDLYFHNAPSYLISSKYLISNDKISDTVTQISSFKEPKLPSVQSQPVCTDPTSTSGNEKFDYIRICPVGCYSLKPRSMPGVLESADFRCPHRYTVSGGDLAAVSIPSSEGNEYPRIGNNSSDATNTINKGNAFPRSGNNSSDSANKINEGNAYSWSGNNSSVSANKINEGNAYSWSGNNSSDSANKINEGNAYSWWGNNNSDSANKINEDDSIPLYIDTSTTEKMGNLLKSTQFSRATTETFTEMLSSMQNSANNSVPKCASNM